METIKLFLILLLTFIVTTSTQCARCIKGEMRLDNSRNWLPLKGKTQLTFVDEANSLQSFALHVIDTLQTYTDQECGSQYKAEYIQVSLYLNSSRTDSIFMQLASPSSLSIRAFSNNNLCLLGGGFINQAPGNEGQFNKRLYNHTVGNRIYQEVILVVYEPGNSNAIDSLMLAKNVGIVGFNYLNKRYALQ